MKSDLENLIHNKFGQPIGFQVDNWKKCDFPPETPMTGNWCRIEILNPEKHAEELFQAYMTRRNDADWTYMPYGPFDQIDDFHEWINKICNENDPFFHAVIDFETQKAIGLASYLRIAPIIGVIEVGNIHFSPLLQKTTHATEAMLLMMIRVFDELGYRRCEWKCDALNARSIKAAGRLGFKFEGIFRQAAMYKSRNRDTAWFSIIDRDWPQLKKSIQLWLNPENFDKDYQQKKSLTEIRSNN